VLIIIGIGNGIGKASFSYLFFLLRYGVRINNYSVRNLAPGVFFYGTLKYLMG